MNSLRANKSSFRRVVVVAVVALAIVPVVLTAIPAVTHITQTTMMNARSELSLLGTSRAKEISTQIELLAVQMLAVGRDSDVRRSVRSLLFLGRADLRLGELIYNNPLVERVYLVDETSAIVTVAPEQKHGEAVDLASLVKNIGSVEKSVIQSFATPTSSGLTVISPVTGIVGRSDGYLVAFITEENILGQANDGLPASVTASLRSLTNSPPNQEEFLTFVVPLGLEKFASLELPDLVFTEPKKARFVDVYNTFYVMTFVLLVLLALLFGIGVLISRFLTQPLEQLTEQAAAYMSGRYNTPKSDFKFREFDDVATTLAEMAVGVEKNIALEKTKAQAELQALRSQMTPHFLFNALNSLITMIDVQPQQAAMMLGKLADLYRLTLNASKSAMAVLSDEVEIVRLYLELERLRFGDRLSFELDISSVSAERVYLPTLTLQTLVENAVKHGVAKARKGGHISLVVKPAENHWLVIVIKNTGKLYDASKKLTSEGTGLVNSVKRLDLLYGERHRFSISTNASDQTEVRFYISGKKKSEPEV